MFNKIGPDWNDNLEENFILFWLDADVNTSEHNRAVQKYLRSLNKTLKIFDNQKQCQENIENDKERRIILIVSGQLGRELVPQIHQYSQILSIYIYCYDKQINEDWTKNFNKVREVIVELNTLLTEIKLARRCRVKSEISLSYNVYTKIETPTNSTVLNKKFTHSIILINAILHFESKPDDKQDLVAYCKKFVKQDKRQLNMLNDFQDKYQSEKALWWYTRESILYRLLNKTLHTQSLYYELPIFHFFFHDIAKQLKDNQCQIPVHVYYGKILWMDEIEHLTNKKDKYLSNLSFWLTNSNRENVVRTLQDSVTTIGEKCVLFEIDANPTLGTTKPFADISKLCHFDSKGEIMFMIGCIFRVFDVDDQGDLWIIRLELCSNDDNDLKQVHQTINEYHQNDKVNLRDFADLFYRLKQYDCAEKVYEQIFDKIPNDNNPSYADLYFARATIAKDKREYDISLKFYKKTLKIKQRTNREDAIDIGRIHACIGAVHRLANNDKEALNCFQRAIDLYKKEHLENHQNMAVFYDNVADVYKYQMNYSKALEYYEQALHIDEIYSLNNSFGVAKSHNNIGCIYYRLNRYEDALKHFLYSLSVKLAILPSQHSSIAKTYTNIASVYRSLGNSDEATNYVQKATVIHRQISISQEQDAKESDDRLETIFLSIK